MSLEAQAPDQPQQDWESELTPERANLAETSNLIKAIMQTLTVSEDPKEIVAGYASDFMKRRGAELPQSEVREIEQARQALLGSTRR